MAILTIENLSFSYPNCKDKALHDISCKIERGDFVAVCGMTGSGKSTFLRMLKPEITPLGSISGSVFLEGKMLNGKCEGIPSLVAEESATKIGYVMQNPEKQIVTDKVWHELAFGLENLAKPQELIRRRVAEIASFFGMEEWFDKDTASLSGGQKQLLNLASVMVMQPDVLLLDEPTAQLDPIAAREFLQTVSGLNRELGVTILMVEHRLEDMLPYAGKMLVLQNGQELAFGETREIVSKLVLADCMLPDLPAAVRMYAMNRVLPKETEAEDAYACPISIREGRKYLEANYKNAIRSLKRKAYIHSEKAAVEFKNVFFRYEKDAPEVLSGLDFSVYEGEIFCLLGGNGSGKSTTLQVLANLNKPYAGYVKVFGRKLKEYRERELYRGCLSMVPQDVQTVFFHESVREELADVNSKDTDFLYDFSSIADRHPYDLSGGQQQLVAFAKALASNPKLFLLDEPTKGLDAQARNDIRAVLKKLKERGVTVIIVTHDVEFAAMTADRCALLFHGEIVASGETGAFFAGNSFYTTAANRMTRGFYDNVVSVEDIQALCKMNGRIKEA